jgi:hypothetical protein
MGNHLICSSSDPSSESDLLSNQITAQQKESEEDSNKTVKVVVLGLANSGKNTLMRQVELCYSIHPINAAHRFNHLSYIQLQILTQLQATANKLLQHNNSNVITGTLIQVNPLLNNSSSSASFRSSEFFEKSLASVVDYISNLSPYEEWTNKTYEAIRTLWNAPLFQAEFNNSLELGEINNPQSVRYYCEKRLDVFQSVEEEQKHRRNNCKADNKNIVSSNINNNDSPTFSLNQFLSHLSTEYTDNMLALNNLDVLHCHIPQLKLDELSINFERTPMHFINLGRLPYSNITPDVHQATSTKKILNQFDKLSFLIYTVDLSSYNESIVPPDSVDGERMNAILASLNYFEEVVNSRHFSQLPIFVLLTKSDLFHQKLVVQQLDIGTYLPNYFGGFDENLAIEWFHIQFEQRNHSAARHFTVIPIDLLSSDRVSGLVFQIKDSWQAFGNHFWGIL